MNYTIEHMPHGIAIRGPIPLGDMGAIAQLGKDNDYDLVDAAISGHLPGITMVIVNAESGNAWRAELGLEGAGILKPPKKREPAVNRVGKPDADPPFQLVDAGDKERTTLRFGFIANHDDILKYTAPVEELFALKGNVLITIDLTDCGALSGDWSRWLNTVAERYPNTKVLLGAQTHHHDAFEARELNALLSKVCW